MIFLSPAHRFLECRSDQDDIVYCAVNCQPGGIHTVNISTNKAFEQLASELRSLGCTHITYWSNPLSTWHQQERLNNMCRAAAACGLQETHHFFESGMSLSDVVNSIDRMRQREERFPALVVSSSCMSHALYTELHQRRLELLQRLQFTGFSHDVPHHSPPFDHISLPTARVGAEAVRLLLKLAMQPQRSAIYVSLEAVLVRQGA